MGNMHGDQDFDLTIPEPQVSHWGGPARVGAELRGVRERLGWKLPDIAARLKIRRVFLEAIEAGNLAALPAPAYAAGFIRSYAEAMGLDPDEVLRRFQAEGMSPPRDPVLTFPKPVPDRAVPPGAIVFLVAVIGIGAYFLWYRHSEHELRMAQQVPTVPAKLAPLAVPKSPPTPAGGTTRTAATPAATTPSANTTTAGGATGGGPTLTAPAAPTSTPGPASSRQIASTTPSSGTAAPASAPNAATPGAAGSVATQADQAAAVPPNPANVNPPAAASSGNAPTTASNGTPSATATSGNAQVTASAQPAVAGTASALLISASADSWVQVRGPHGAVLFSRLLKAGQTWPVPNEPGLTLTTGNAGGTELIRNGVTGQPLGKNGAVLHNIQLTPSATGDGTGPAPGSAAQ